MAFRHCGDVSLRLISDWLAHSELPLIHCRTRLQLCANPGDSHIRHLISDEVGLGKTVQALMIVNALRWQDPKHRTLVIAPDNLLSQWQEECWIRGHVMPAIAGALGHGTHDDLLPITLARPRDLMTRPGQGTRTIAVLMWR